MATLEHPRSAGRTALFAPLDAPEARITSEEYDRSFLDAPRPVPKVELVRGRLIFHHMPYRLHARALARVLEAFVGIGLSDLEVLPTVTSTFGEDRFEPDVALIRPHDKELNRMVDRSEIQLAIEVSVSSLVYDRGEKTIYYAEGGIPEYWIVNPVARQIEIYRRPENGAYQDVYLLLPGEQMDALCLPGHEFAVDDLLPSVATDGSETA